MKDLVTYLIESNAKESRDFDQFAMEIVEEGKNLAKYFKGAESVKVGSSKTSLFITVYTKKGQKLDVAESLKEVVNNSKNYEYCANEVVYSAWVHNKGEKDCYEIIIELESVAQKNFNHRKKVAATNKGKFIVEPTKL